MPVFTRFTWCVRIFYTHLEYQRASDHLREKLVANCTRKESWHDGVSFFYSQRQWRSLQEQVPRFRRELKRTTCRRWGRPKQHR